MVIKKALNSLSELVKEGRAEDASRARGLRFGLAAESAGVDAVVVEAFETLGDAGTVEEEAKRATGGLCENCGGEEKGSEGKPRV